LRRLGVPIEVTKDRVRIAGVGLGGLKAPHRALDAENSGSTIRMLAGVLAGQPFKSTLTGDSSLRKRPMRRIVEPLCQMGAGIHTESGDRAPLEIQGGKLRAIDYTTPVPSAQVKSAILLAGLYADGVTTVRESVRTRDHTELALREFGATVDVEKGLARIHPRPKLLARQLTVPGDLSAAVFMIGAALVLPGSELMLHNVGLNPTRTRVLDFLISIGAPINIASVQLRDGELVGDVAVRHAPLSGGSISGAQVAEMIDELPMLAALGPYTEKGIEIRDAKELRVKESDRIAAHAEGLRQMGATVEEFPDGLRVAGHSAAKLRGAKVDPQGDHRIAMALAVAALGAEGNTTIRAADCAAVSFPEFFTKLDELRGKT
jgi:3-phosphoshikimate 1-carboxyvinyltransferase